MTDDIAILVGAIIATVALYIAYVTGYAHGSRTVRSQLSSRPTWSARP